MFEADSLRPPGMEFLNDPGPSWEVLENQYIRKPMYYKWQEIPTGCGKGGFTLKFDQKTCSVEPVKWSTPLRKEYFTQQKQDNKTKSPGEKKDKKEGFNVSPSNIVPTGNVEYPKPRAGIDPEDMEWSVGQANRLPEQALAEYYGSDDCISSEVILDQTKLGYGGQAGGKTYGELYATGKDWVKRGGSRFQRYERPPYWQDAGAYRPYEHDIDETLTQGVLLESDNQVRRWDDITRLRSVDGEQYRNNGPLQNSRP